MNTKKVIKALENWSPNGLCSGVLVQANGIQAKTEACSVGCLALEFLHSKPGKSYARTRGGLKTFIQRALYDEDQCDGELDEAINKYFNLTPDGDEQGDLERIMRFNDHVGADKPPEDIAYEKKRSGLPKPLQSTILRLRKRFDKWDSERGAAEKAKSEIA